MWDELRIQCSDASEIAEALINREVTLTQLMSVPVFMGRASMVDDAAWDLCNSRNDFQRYMDIYPNGRHVADANAKIAETRNREEQEKWNDALKVNNMTGYIGYLHAYPNGVHAAEVDDKVWAVAEANGTYDAYVTNFPNGKHTDEVRARQEEQRKDEEAWQSACSNNTSASYEFYKESYPHGMHVAEATAKVIEIMKEQKENIIRDLEEDSNAYPLGYLKVCGITANDLRDKVKDSKGQIRNEVLKSWDKNPVSLRMGKTPTSIPEGNTEVYFWGVPGSGKTCAMAAILSMARKGNCFEPREGEGLGYMNQLSTMFLGDPNKPAVCFPTASDVDTTQYLPLTLNETVRDRRGHESIKEHKLAVVEISGEIFECFSCEVEGRTFKTGAHKATYEQLKKYLENTDNPKYHYFILDSRPLHNADQVLILQNAATYFKTHHLFNSTTQGISLIVTKCDQLSPDRNRWKDSAMEAADEYFGSLVTQLKKILGNPGNGGLGLTNGTIDVVPLSIGEVFFQSLCLFDPEPASVLVKQLIEYSKVAETDSWRRRTRNVFRR
ncbi:MAG: hypothetical protein KBT57_01090 [bacterium]|nr:hypothetical protein [Candidatus Limimorpha equi]